MGKESGHIPMTRKVICMDTSEMNFGLLKISRKCLERRWDVSGYIVVMGSR